MPVGFLLIASYRVIMHELSLLYLPRFWFRCTNWHFPTQRKTHAFFLANEIADLSKNILTEMGAEDIDIRPIRNVTNNSLAHCAGTCRAGIDPDNSVINPYFESHDIENLFICDASAAPRQQQYGAMPTAAIASYAWRQIVDRHFS